MLDHPKIDIFIHFDAKNKSYDPAETLKLTKYSRIFHTPRIKVSWGGYSQIKAELILLEAAASQGHYGHYHLLSGADLPIKKSEDIIKFFEEHSENEFVGFQSRNFGYEDRIRYYYPFQELNGRRGNRIVRVLSRISLKLQKMLHVHRNKGINFQKGSQWFSITDKFARYVLSKREWIHKVFHDTVCADEIFLHTLLLNSDFYEKRAPSSMRFIDWNRGSPYTFRLSDLEQIKASQAMFARKFQPSVDAEIIERVSELYS